MSDNMLTPDQIDALLKQTKDGGAAEATPGEATPGEATPDEATPQADQPEALGSAAPNATPNAQPRAMETNQLNQAATNDNKPLDLDFILDIPLQVTVEVGRTRMLIQELLQLSKGSVVELNKLLGEAFDILVNDKLVAHGEVVIVNDRFGIRITDITSPNERVQTLAHPNI